MFTLKAFIEIPAFIDNTLKTVSPLGELSNMSSSYSTEKGVYTKTTSPNVELITFTSERDGSLIPTPTKYHSHILDVAQWVFSQSISGTIIDNAERFRTLFLSQFQSSIGTVEIGEMVTAKSNWMPAFIKWNLDDGGEENTLQIWFSDSAFSGQYPGYEHIVISSVVPVDTFMKTSASVKPALAAFNLPDHDVKVAELAKSNPYSNRITSNYMWYDREDSEVSLETYWTVVIYGVAGNNPLLIKKAIADYILENSSYPKEEWLKVFPDIFTSTEFTIVPLWHLRSVEDETVRGQLYSPIAFISDAMIIGTKYIQYPKANHVVNNLTLMPVHYKSVMCVLCGGDENRDGNYRITDYLKEYAMIPTSSPDFNRMPQRVTDWIFKIQGAIIAAEEMDEYSYLGLEYARVERNGLQYVGFTYDNVLYLVMARTSMSEASDEIIVTN